MKKRTVLITGTSSGIGREIVRQFLEKGFRVIATARRIESIRDFNSENVIPFKLDVTKDDEINSLVRFLEKEKLNINILVNNAGFGLMGPAAETAVEKYKEVFETNFFGQIKLTQSLLPFIPKSNDSRIVNIGSISGVLPTPFASPYCASKAAFNSFSDALRMELKPFKIKVISVQPGAVKSDFGKNASIKTSDALQDSKMYKDYVEKIRRRATVSQERATDVVEFVDRLVAVILKKNPPAMFRAGKLSIVGPFIKKCLSEKVVDKILLKVFGI